jgi:hypothetical protein
MLLIKSNSSILAQSPTLTHTPTTLPHSLNSLSLSHTGFVCEGKTNILDKPATRQKAMVQRKRIMDVIEADSLSYTDAVLGMPRAQYLTYLVSVVCVSVCVCESA